MSLYPEHKNQKSEVHFLTRHRERKENEKQESGEVQRKNREKERLKTATPQEAKNYLKGLVQKVMHFHSLREVLVTNSLEEGKAGPLENKQKGTVVSSIETSEGKLPVSDEVWKEGMKLLAEDLDWDLESDGIETRTKREEGKVRYETKMATIETEIEMWKGVHLERIVEFDQDSRPTLISYEVFWLF